MIVTDQNFNAPTLRAYAGPGAYFWEYEGSPDTAKELAELWWYHSFLAGSYKGELDDTCGIVGVELQDPSSDDVLDIATHDFRHALREVLAKVVQIDDSTVHQLTAAVIDRFAAARGKPILLVKPMVKPPPLGKGRQRAIAQWMISSWPCFVVRNGGERLFARIFAM